MFLPNKLATLLCVYIKKITATTKVYCQVKFDVVEVNLNLRATMLKPWINPFVPNVPFLYPL